MRVCEPLTGIPQPLLSRRSSFLKKTTEIEQLTETDRFWRRRTAVIAVFCLRKPAAMQAKRNPKLPQQLQLDTVSPATRLLEKRRQMFEVQEALDAQKEEFER